MLWRKLRSMLESCLLALLLVSFPPNAAWADKSAVADARRHYENGVRHHEAKKYAQALLDYRKALSKVRRPSIILAIAQCLRKMSQDKEALNHYLLYKQEWRRKHPNKKLRFAKEVDAHIDSLGAKVRAEELKQKLAEQKRQEALREEIERERIRRLAELDAKRKAELAAKQAREQEQQRLADKRAAEQRENREVEDQRRRKAILGYTTIGVGTAAAIVAGVLYGVAKSQGNPAHERYQASRDGKEVEMLWQDVAAANSKLIGSYAMIGVAAASFAVSIYAFVSSPEKTTATAVAIVPASDGSTLIVSGSF
jgi:hypothetical protein